MRKEVISQVECKLREYPQLRGQESRLARLWCDAIGETLDELTEDRRRMVALRYFDGLSEEDVQRLVPVGRSCYRKWRADVVATVAAKAAYLQLLVP